MAQSYQKLELKQYPHVAARQTAENRFWKSFRFPIITKNLASVTHIHFAEQSPHDFAVTSSSRVFVYSTASNQVKRNITRFKDVAYGGTLRDDGKLLLAGGEHPVVKLFELSTKAVLRSFKGHTGAVRVTKFSSNNTSVFTASDDNTIRLWDVASGTTLVNLTEHADYVRCLAMTKNANQVWASASYDHTIKIWDSRTVGADKGNNTSAMTFDHGDSVESLLILPNGGTVISAGGNEIKVWDVLAGRLIHSFSNHQKTITTLFFNHDHSRLFSGSLDRNLKVYDMKTYNVVHSSLYPSPILSGALSPSTSHLVIGMTDGLLSIRHRETKGAGEGEEGKPLSVPSHREVKADVVVERQKKKKLNDVDQLLRKFRYRESVEAAILSRDPVIFVSLLSDLLNRNVLRNALAGRDAEGLVPLLKMVCKYITHPRYSMTLLHSANVLIDIYAPVLGQSSQVDYLFCQLAAKLKKEIALQESMMSLLGSVEFVVHSSQVGSQTPTPSER